MLTTANGEKLTQEQVARLRAAARAHRDAISSYLDAVSDGYQLAADKASAALAAEEELRALMPALGLHELPPGLLDGG